MSTTPDETEMERRVHTLLRERNPIGAIQILEEARSAARVSGNPSLAAHYSSLLGSVYLSEDRWTEAIREYEAAETDAPDNVYHKLTTARRLLEVDRLTDALSKLDSISQNLPKNPSTIHTYYGLRGEACFRLNKIDDALREFRAMSSPELVRSVMTISLSLDLAKLLLTHGVGRSDCLEYLATVKAKAISRRDDGLLETVMSLERLAGM